MDMLGFVLGLCEPERPVEYASTCKLVGRSLFGGVIFFCDGEASGSNGGCVRSDDKLIGIERSRYANELHFIPSGRGY